MNRRSVMWAAAAVLGIVATAAVAWAASQLATQRIGLSSSPLSGVNRLAPPSTVSGPAPHRRLARRGPSIQRPAPAPPVAVLTTTVTAPPPAPRTAPQPAPRPATTTSPPPRARTGTAHRDDGGSSSSRSGSRQRDD